MTNVENRAVSWIRLSDYQILTNGLRKFTGDKRFKLLHSVGSSEWTLELVSVSEKDEGGYQCQVRSRFISYITSHHITSHHIISHHITSHHITSHHITYL